MCCIFPNCYKNNNILSMFINKQRKDEYKKNKMNMAYIGNNPPKNVYHGYTLEINNNDIISGLNSFIFSASCFRKFLFDQLLKI